MRVLGNLFISSLVKIIDKTLISNCIDVNETVNTKLKIGIFIFIYMFAYTYLPLLTVYWCLWAFLNS